jgi:uncharacterized glyoxalase superfamily protein PhnB
MMGVETMDTQEVRFLGITLYLHYDDIVSVTEWLKRVFGFDEKGRWLDSNGRVRNAELSVGGTEVWLDGDPDWWRSKGRRPEEWIGVWVDDVDAMYARVKAAGIAVDPPESKFYAERVLQVADPEGYVWGFMQRAPYVARIPESK